jgi:hemin uptake protein HemP
MAIRIDIETRYRYVFQAKLPRCHRRPSPPAMMNQNPTPPSPADPQPQPKRIETRQISSGDLLRGDREILIEHDGKIYRLSVTRSGKLILHT